jgi:predicted GH43/DUF377 family glycosyl hydrolase
MSRLCAILLLGIAVLTSGCRSYDSFVLPPPPGSRLSDAQLSSPTWRAQPDPVISPQSNTIWESSDVLNPSVVRFKGQYWNLYSGFDGKTWRTGSATSMDGSQWRRRKAFLTPEPKSWEADDYIAANGAAIVFQNQLLYFYQAGKSPQIGLAKSKDGDTWTKVEQPVLPKGPRGSWDELAVADPYVIQVDGTLYLYYLGMDRAKRQRLGVAKSADGVRWTKLRTNPVLELGTFNTFDANGLGEPAVWAQHGRYWMLYTGRAKNEVRALGLAESADGVHWKKRDNFVIRGEADWNRQVLCDPTVEVQGDQVRVWFGGGDQAKPDERINGKIGVATLTLHP